MSKVVQAQKTTEIWPILNFDHFKCSLDISKVNLWVKYYLDITWPTLRCILLLRSAQNTNGVIKYCKVF